MFSDVHACILLYIYAYGERAGGEVTWRLLHKLANGREGACAHARSLDYSDFNHFVPNYPRYYVHSRKVGAVHK